MDFEKRKVALVSVRAHRDFDMAGVYCTSWLNGLVPAAVPIEIRSNTNYFDGFLV